MDDNIRSALHQVHTATNDVLKGYDTMLKKADPEIRPILVDLNEMHERHSAEQQEELRRLGETAEGDASWRGVVNSAVVTIRDWVSGLDEGSLATVRQGEESLRNIYDSALAGFSAADAPELSTLLTNQYHEIGGRISGLPVV